MLGRIYNMHFCLNMPCMSACSSCLCTQVLTGYAKDFGTKQDKSLRMPPLIPIDDQWYGAVADDENKRFSSVTAEAKGSRIYMTYTQGAVRQYAHYIVTYKSQ